MPPILRICTQLRAQVVEVEAALGHACRASFSASSLSTISAAFSTSETTSPMSRMRAGHALGVERLQRVELLAHADELDRLAGDVRAC